jgi:tagatose 1,6-diphosphate aldolase
MFRLLSRPAAFLSREPAFTFLDPGPLVDNDLELLRPSRKWTDAVLAACHHPLTYERAPDLTVTTRENLNDFLQYCPGGNQPRDVCGGILPTYHFWMHVPNTTAPVIAGGIGLRVGNTYDIDRYYGHIGYHVYPASRGQHLAERSCRLLFPLARRHGINPVWITCNPDNHASRRTCERLGGHLVEIVPVPFEHALYHRGEKEKCRYRIDL